MLEKMELKKELCRFENVGAQADLELAIVVLKCLGWCSVALLVCSNPEELPRTSVPRKDVLLIAYRHLIVDRINRCGYTAAQDVLTASWMWMSRSGSDRDCRSTCQNRSQDMYIYA